jgi:hypothetical protein
MRQTVSSPTPTYDPLVEPPLPPNPTELELGQNLYWHWCMTCHGDRGQGLTDEFREIWEEDHQNCWARGCHAGRPGDLGFPIPTFVPGVVVEDHLVRFSSLREFAEFLKATHPPQSPGILKDEEYHAIALFVFTMNGRTVEADIPIPTPTSTLIPLPSPVLIDTPLPATRSTDGLGLELIGFVSGVVMFGVLVFVRVTMLRGRDKG